MHFGWYINPETSGPEHDSRHIAEVLEQAKRAEELGFRAIWITEHHFTPYNTYSDCLLLAAHLAALTPRLWLGFSLAVLPIHHPIRFAEQANLLDQLTHGRIIIGVGSGYGPTELAGFGVEASRRHELFDETMEVVFRAWAHEDGVFEYATSLHRGRVVGRIIPRSYRRPHPYVARGTVHPDFAEAWGERGQPVLLAPFGSDHLRTMLAAHQRGLARAAVPEEQKREVREWTAVVYTIHVAESDEQARREFEPYLNQHLVSYQEANTGIKMTWEEVLDKKADFVTRFAQNQTIIGSPETVAARLRAIGELGIRHVMCWMNTGGTPHDLVLRSQELFAREVMPRLAEVGEAAPAS
jgi:alkanesulfonate monooxygenase SsuD/methylene tetrahydromethanopterin reductase-like flavin-dependent oxidoreductase (luciferase family)